MSEPRHGLTRRGLLVTGLALASLSGVAGPAAGAAAVVPAGPLLIHPREQWAGNRRPAGPLQPEQPGDVRFLLVHHTASSNRYLPDGVVEQLRGFYRFHTGPEKGWPDLAYNFMIDRYGGVWEGRAGSLEGPVQVSATGGSQGYAQLACFIGDLSDAPPTAAARTAMLQLLAMLADRYDIDTAPGAAATFTSRGSSRRPLGTAVTTPTIAAHRDMSLTTCPGDGVYEDVHRRFPAEVSALRARPTLRSRRPAATGPPASRRPVASGSPSASETLVAPRTSTAPPAVRSPPSRKGSALPTGPAVTPSATRPRTGTASAPPGPAALPPDSRDGVDLGRAAAVSAIAAGLAGGAAQVVRQLRGDDA